MTNEESRRNEWAALYSELLSALAPFGRNDSFGDGDFWLVDDDWGQYQHKLCISKLSFLTREVVSAIQRTLKKHASDWEVVVALEFDDPHRAPEGEGLLVRQSKVEPRWNAERLAWEFGAEFRWEAQ